ncbi:MAG: succinate--CoA ligase subunit alpha [Candidatus Magasanikbacteria bacterium CG10_big_fil_rev_8_21_14_0_10_43_6]|uniref:Succinate--CoA ligase subunit alpha n=1 Tax=Candidatus Magasanikbacteria bacterium CG10_big_fil_rev_8_21_14_0_10_43_6 TaxID=1974650 RepID=A0A2M6W1I7_9BACT|nr:MAG: succinate--CoA ligase subunit alpha [Candidatus Magasanikbacteria bacterium CG10_big_fil_rev_8_21_14_0_10_43_6]
MGILIDQQTTVLVQGITGKEGQKAAEAMLAYGTNVVGGVRPGKGGEEVLGKPVFNTVREAVDAIPGITVSTIYVPPFAAKAAIMEAIDANIPHINTIVERIPIKDTAYCLAAAKEKGIQIIGPSSLGYITPGVGRIGVVGGIKVDEVFTPGSIGIISRSGGMTNEVSWQMRKAGMGQSTAVHVGGDLLMGTTYADLLLLFEKDFQTNAVAIFGEHGGSYEFEIVDVIVNKEFTKPLAVYVGGKFANVLPEGMNIGHAGAIVERGKGAKEKEAALADVGVMIAERYEDLVELVQPFS